MADARPYSTHGSHANGYSVFTASRAPSKTTVPMSFADGDHMRIRTRILGEFASKDYNVLKSNIILFPLHFVSSSDESKFFGRILDEFPARARLSSITTFFLFFMYWVCVAICLGNHTFLCAGKTTEIVFSVCMAVMTLSASLPYIASSHHSLRPFTEASTYVIVLLAATLLGSWMVLNAILEPGYSILDIVEFQNLKMWINLFIYFIPFWSCLLMDVLMEARTRTSFWVHIANCVLFSGASIVQTILLMQKSEKSLVINEHQQQFFIVSTILDCFYVLCMSTFLFTGRWFLELQERIEFLRRMKATEQIHKLKEQAARRKRKKGATVIEDVLTLVERVMTNIEYVLVESNLPLLAEGAELLTQCQQILTETDNLYSVRYQAKDGEATEGEALEEQFFQIYTDKQIQRLPTRVRFGETTGVEFDSAAAARDISKPGQAPSLSTARSFGLAHLHDLSLKISGVETSIIPQMNQTDAMRIGRDWETDILKLHNTYENVLLEVGAALLIDKVDNIQIPAACLLNYLKRLQDTYPPNPYHNQIHGAAVAHATSCLMRMLCLHEATEHKIINDIAVTIAALGHDAGHPARNNTFFVNASDPVAVIYSDSAVLENAHSAITFKCLECRGCNIFANVTPELFRGVRKHIIELILATDMAQHFESVSRFRLRRQAAGFNYLRDLDDMWHVIRMCIKCADLSHALFDWSQHFEWSLRLSEEFYQQGEDEAALGLKISPLCDRSQHSEFAKSQKGFIEFVVQPLISQMEELEFGAMIGIECVRRLMYNKYKWEEWSKAGIPVPLTDFKGVRTDPMNCLKTLVDLYAEGQVLVQKVVKAITMQSDASLFISGAEEGEPDKGDKTASQPDGPEAEDDSSGKKQKLLSKTTTMQSIESTESDESNSEHLQKAPTKIEVDPP